MKVMLLSLRGLGQSEGDFFPLGIGYLLASLKRFHGVRAYCFNDLRQAKSQIIDSIKIFTPDIVGFTCDTFNRGLVKESIKWVRGVDKNIKIIAGGVHASFCHEQVLNHYGADIIVLGEGEDTIVNLCNALQNSSSLSDVAGIAYKENNKIVLNAPSNFINDLDIIPMPDYSYAASFIERSKMGFLITSRGCPVRCTFCSSSSFWGQKVRMHSVERVVAEMQMLINQFKVKRIFFHDDTFNLSVDRVKAICREIINCNIDVEWGCSCRVNPVSEEMISTMVSAGCRHICWGIESGSESILKKINKNVSLTQIRNAFEISKKFTHLTSIGAFTMVGNPGETEGTIKETIKFLNTIPLTDSPSTSILYVLPGTTLYEDLREKGYIKDSDWVKYNSVPLYTVENSYETLCRWHTIVENSGIRIPFKQEKHFWYKVFIHPQIKPEKRVWYKVFIHPQTLFLICVYHIKKIVSKVRLYLFNSKERLSW